MSSRNNIKLKKPGKDVEKKKSQPSTSSMDVNSNDKGSPSPEKESRQYAGIGPDIIRNYAEQCMFETHLSKDLCNLLSEDINYKLRHLIHDSLLKARLSGKNVITSREIDESFNELSIDTVYGAPVNPNWVQFAELPGTGGSDQTFIYVEDYQVNLIELVEQEITEVQYGDTVVSKEWHSQQDSGNAEFKNYFSTACQGIISNDAELRGKILKNISENNLIGPIMQWFYHFGYFLLMKNVTYDSLTLRALDLIETLENCPLGYESASVKQLKLLVRLLLQRLLLTYSSPDVLRRLCFTLSILCLRKSLRDMTIEKLNQKLDGLQPSAIQPVLNIIYFLGMDSIKKIFLPRITFFIDRIPNENNGDVLHVLLAIYSVICKTQHIDNYLHKWFDILIPNDLITYWSPTVHKKEIEKLEMNFIAVRTKLIKTRRKLDCVSATMTSEKPTLEESFSLPPPGSKLRRKLEDFRFEKEQGMKQISVTVGETSLLLPEFIKSSRNKRIMCCDHSLMSYVI